MMCAGAAPCGSPNALTWLKRYRRLGKDPAASIASLRSMHGRLLHEANNARYRQT